MINQPSLTGRCTCSASGEQVGRDRDYRCRDGARLKIGLRANEDLQIMAAATTTIT
jgi:hypothetical protein